MSSMESIVAAQKQLEVAISKLYTNFMKDSADRKNAEYIRRRLEALEQYFAEFHNNHMNLLSFDDQSHEYFTTNLYEQVKANYNQSKLTFSSYQPVAEKPQTPFLKPPTFVPESSTMQNPSHKSIAISSKTEEYLKKQASNFKAFMRTASNIDLDLVSEKWEFEDLLKTLHVRWAAIDSLHWELDSELNGSNRDYEQQFSNYEKYFNDLKKSINKKMWSVAHVEKSTPTMEIATFNGNYNQWVSFKDLFTESVHNNPSLSNAQKLQFLKSKIKGEPEKLIQHLQISSDNYLVCWQILNHRYDNKRLIFTSHLTNLMNIPISQQQSSQHIKRIHDTTYESINGIRNLGIDISSWDPFLVHLLSQKLDAETYNDYIQSLKSPRDLPILKDFLNFLETKFMMLETSRKKQEYSSHKTSNFNQPPTSKSLPNPNFKQNYYQPQHAFSSNQVISQSNANTNIKCKPCLICNDDHRIHLCPTLLKMQPYARKKAIMNLNLCVNCLHYHEGKKCFSSIKCKECNREHNTLLHATFTSTSRNVTPDAPRGRPSVATVTNDAFLQKSNDPFNSEVLLATAIVKVQAADGTYLVMRCLIDQGSQISIISHRAAQLLKIPRRKCYGVISVVGNKDNSCKGMISINCMSMLNDFTFSSDVFIMNKLVKNLPSYNLPKPEWPTLNHIALADPEFYLSRPIDILFGADIYSLILMEGICRSGQSLPLAQQTRLGWILSGHLETKTFQCNMILNNLDEIQQFWEIEDVHETSDISEEDQNCIDLYKSSTLRREDGSYVVKIPFKENFQEKLGESRSKSVAQFYQIEKKLIKQPTLARDYKSFMSEYLSLGHMIPSTISVNDSPPDCYLSHHAVLRNESSTTRLRVVFNASAKTSSGFSLNDLMCSGPNLQQDLQDLILKWRQFKYGFTADIEKMFRKIWLHPEHQKYQKIIWRDNQSQPLQTFNLASVTYGFKSSPFLAMMTLRQLANDERHNYPNSIAPDLLEQSFYMDDLLHGSHSEEAAINLQKEMISLLKLGGFNLRKWRSNLPILNEPCDDLKDESFEFKQAESTKTLGLCWIPKDDTFTFHPIQFDSTLTSTPTKRQLLSEISKIFDPLGWLTPVTIKLKILFQDTWKLNLDWDQSIPSDLASIWEKIKKDISQISHLKIPRWIQTQENESFELHGFCDASTLAYSCVVYCKIRRGNKSYVTLIAGKSKLVPVKKVLSLPRLELCGALLLSRLFGKILSNLSTYNIIPFAWVDSTAVLGWLRGKEEKWKPFVANRVRKICSVIPGKHWRYVKSAENSADCASRGITASQLISHPLWWTGPSWLQDPEIPLPPETTKYTTNEDLLKTKQVNSIISQDSILKSIINKYSSLNKAIRVLAYVYRFVDTYVHKKKCGTYLTLYELKRAKEMIIKYVQQETFSSEINQLKSKQPLNSKSLILPLNPILDEKGLLRVGGRLRHSNLDPEMRHPIIIPNHCNLADLIIDESHKLVFHGGAKMTTGFIRQKYWILGGNNAIKKRLRMCVICKKHEPILKHQLMGDLPPSRITPSRPFYHTGVDYTGYIFIKANKGRGVKTLKGYIAVFVCMVTKAVHLEVVSDLTASAFIAALRRMAARRGVPEHLYSDQGTNFTGANNILKHEYEEILKSQSDPEVMLYISSYNITWHFNAPAWPSAGGLWEAAVKSLKYHLKRVVGEQKLTYEEYSTLLSQLEACLNSRPLCPLTEDPDDLNFLTPSHFLASGPNLTIIETEKDLRTRWYLTQKIYQDIWVKWKNEYLSQLSVRSKWTLPQKNLDLNDLVIIKDDNLPPGKWTLGRIVQLHSGRDGKVRVVSLKTKNGITKRPVVKLSLLQATDKPQDEQMTSIRDEHVKNPTPNKSKKMSFSAMALYLTLFFVTLISSSQASHHVHPLRNNSVYFDKITNMNLIKDNWHLIVYYDTYPYKEGITVLNKYIKYLEPICLAIREQTPCDSVMLQLKHGFEEIKHYDYLMTNSSYVTRDAPRRWRRGLINGVGYIANSLFGVLDQHFADQYEKDIDLIKSNENHLYNLWKNQTSVVEAELNLMKRIESTMSQHHKLINQKINILTENYRDIESQVQNISFTIDFITSTMAANNILYNLRRVQDSILDTITDIYTGKLDFHLLSPQQLRRELSTIAAQLPKDLASPIDNIDLAEVYNLLRVKAKLSEKYLIIELKIPLIERDLFEIFNLISIPQKSNNDMLYVDMTSDLAAINLKKDLYLPVSERDLRSCITQNPKMILCHIRKPIFHMRDDHTLCVKNSNSRTCKTLSKPCQNKWIELHAENNYFYFCCDECHIKLLCEDQVTAVQLRDAGLFTVDEGCIIKSEDFMIFSYKEQKSKIYTSPVLDAPAIAPINHIMNISISKMPTDPDLNITYSSDLEQFNELKKSIETLKQSEPIGDIILYHNVHHYVAIYLIIGSAFLAIAIYCCKKGCLSTVLRRPRRETTPPISPPQQVELTLSTSVKDNSDVSKCCDVREHGQFSNRKSAVKKLNESTDCVTKQERGSSPIFRVFSLPDLNFSDIS